MTSNSVVITGETRRPHASARRLFTPKRDTSVFIRHSPNKDSKLGPHIYIVLISPLRYWYCACGCASASAPVHVPMSVSAAVHLSAGIVSSLAALYTWQETPNAPPETYA